MYAFLPDHMRYLGFNFYNIRLITLISALVSIIGPVIVGLILDNVSIKRPSAYGKWLRSLLFIFFILAGLMFGSLLFLYTTELKADATVTFSCNDHGGHVFIRSNFTGGKCMNIMGRTGDLKLLNCSYTCEVPENFKHLYETVDINRGLPARLTEDTANLYSSENPSSDYDYEEVPAPEPLVQAPTSAPMIPPPHICITKENGTTNQTHCHVQLPELRGKIILISDVVGMRANEKNNQFGDEWCMHPLGKLKFT
jgi:MFS_1 like family